MTETRSQRKAIGQVELIALLSMTMAIGAIGIDLMLPAFPLMREEFGLGADSNEIAATVTAYILGFSAGALFFGPLSDRFGRKPALYLGFGVYAVGALASVVAPTLGLLIGARVVWGFGAAAARTIALSVIRDIHAGDRMTRIMSFVFAVFILVPIVAPALGAAVISIGPWQLVFWTAALFALLIAIWTMRLPETLDPANRIRLGPADLGRAALTVFTTRQTFGHMMAFTVSFGAFVSYLASSQLIVEDVLGRGDQFPIIFGGISAVVGAAIFLNGSIVERFGTVRVVRFAALAYVVGSAAFLILSLSTGGRPGLWPFIVSMSIVLAMHAMVIPNSNSRAMDPMGAIAGTASAVIGAVTGAVGALLGAIIDGFYNGTVTPLAIGFVLSSILALSLVTWAERDGSPRLR